VRITTRKTQRYSRRVIAFDPSRHVCVASATYIPTRTCGLRVGERERENREREREREYLRMGCGYFFLYKTAAFTFTALSTS
jgi:hypothetical protein